MEQQVVDAERPFNPHLKTPTAKYYDLDGLLQQDNSLLLVAECEGEIIATGYAQIRQSKQSITYSQYGYLGFMYVVPEFRGQGLNRRIIDQLVYWCQQKGIEHFHLDVYQQNQSAMRAYEKYGFEPELLLMTLHTDKANYQE